MRTRLTLTALVSAACTAQVSNPNNQAPQQNGEQAETDLVIARDANTNAPVLVSSYRWTGPSPLGLGNDIDYGSGGGNNLSKDVAFHRGASVAGHAYSFDGKAWVAPLKIRPPSRQFPILWGDARLSVDRAHPYRVAMINLAVSDQEFRAAQGYDANTDSLLRWPTAESEFTVPPQCTVIANTKACDIIDSACVTFSSNAGKNFAGPICHQERRCSQSNAACFTDTDCGTEACAARSLDQPSVTFDSNGLAVPLSGRTTSRRNPLHTTSFCSFA